ncbi:Protein SPA1-RELATED 3 [Ancistrocladus abbreviatus]
MSWSQICYYWTIMGGSSETGRRKPHYSRGLDTTASSDRNLRLLRASRISLSADASRDSEFGTESKVRDGAGKAPGDVLRNHIVSGVSEGDVAADPFVCGIHGGDVSLRQWLANPERSVDAIECLHIFRQIADIVNIAHSQGIVVNNVQPSCFVLSSFNNVSFIKSASCSDSGSDSLDDGLNSQSREISTPHDLPFWKGRLGHEEFQTEMSVVNTSQPMADTSGLQSSSGQVTLVPFVERKGECESKDSGSLAKANEEKQFFPMEDLLLKETTWYSSPEEIAGAPSSCASDIYRLGVLLFELFCTFSSTEEKSRIMSSLHCRVLPLQLLLKWPKESSFCLWLLHPDPCSRPKMGELLRSEFLNESRNDIEECEGAIGLRQKIEEQELLLEFLVLMRKTKHEAADKLQDAISLLSSDIEEIKNMQRALKKKGVSLLDHGKVHYSPLDLALLSNVEQEEATSLGQRKCVIPGLQDHNVGKFDYHPAESCMLDMETGNQENLLFNESRLMNNFKKLESAYLLCRRRSTKPSGKQLTGHSPLSSNGRGSVVLTEKIVNNSLSKEGYNQDEESGWVNPFLEGLCKYLSFTKLRVEADLKQGDLLNSSNLVCSVSFDRDGDFFAAAGVNKKIKVFECDAIINEDHDIHYPVVEMASRSKLSSVCWNSYIKSQIASSNFEGVVQVWDVTRSQVFMELQEHERRVWSVDFSIADPKILASGSDDGSVKLWSINQGASIGTIKTKANVCCVQFPLDTGRSLAFGSADHRAYYYDLRNPKVPLCTLIGHNRTVSYVKFVDSTNLVSASTDNTLKLWDLSMCSSRVLDSPLQSFTGHRNVKNFVGLSVLDGYIATGSETNEVFVYHKAFPMPALSHKFSSVDPLSGHGKDDTAQFVSSLCWRGQSTTLVAANSAGNIKLLEMV